MARDDALTPGVDAPAPPTPEASERRNLGRMALALVGLGLLVWALFAGLTMLRAAHQLQAGERSIKDLRGSLTASELRGARPVEKATAARSHFRTAAALLRSRTVAPLWALPVAGRQMESLATMATAAGRVSTVGATGLRDVRALLTTTDTADPKARVQTVARLGVIADQSFQALGPVDLGPSHALIGPIAKRRRTFAKDLGGLRDALDRGRAGAAGLADLLNGPHRYLVLAANNGEMRAGSGMFLSAGVLETNGGKLELRDFQPTALLALPGDGVPMSGDIAARWGTYHPNREWRNLGLWPDFDKTAELASRMWTARSGEVVDGVLGVDVVAFSALLRFTGPVAGPEGPIGVDDAQRFLLHDQYLHGDPDSLERRDALGAIAASALAGLDQPSDSVAMARSLATSAEGRHVFVWSSNRETQQRWVDAGVDGALRNDDLLVAVLNRGANKLDQFLKVTVRVERAVSGDATSFALHVTMRNDAPPGEVPYVAGPSAEPGGSTMAGEYKGILSVNVPAAVTSASVDGATAYAAIGAEGATSVVAVPADLQRGEIREFVVRFTQPGGHGTLRVVPSARVPDVLFSGVWGMFTDARPKVVSW